MSLNLSDRIFLVTGASSGIGREVVLALAKMKATVVGVARAEGRGGEQLAAIRSHTGNDRVHFLPADLSLMVEVRRLAVAFKADYPRLDGLVNNAGVFSSRRRLTEEGLELTFALNHLAYYLLTILLLEPLLASAPARVVNTSSGAERMGRMHFDDLMLERDYGGWKAYGQSKLANLLFTFELARRLAGTGVTANAFHPGLVATNFGHGNRSFSGRLLPLIQRLFARTPERGADTAVYLATSPEVEGVTGGYYKDRRPLEPSPQARDHVAQQRLWELSAQLVKLDDTEASVLGDLPTRQGEAA